MSMIETIHETIAAIVGNCYPLTVPEKPVAPYAIYLQVSNSPDVVLESLVAIDNTRLQVDIFAKTYAEVQSLSNQVRDALMALNIIPLSSGDLYESEVKLYRVTQDFSVWH